MNGEVSVSRTNFSGAQISQALQRDLFPQAILEHVMKLFNGVRNGTSSLAPLSYNLCGMAYPQFTANTSPLGSILPVEFLRSSPRYISALVPRYLAQL